MRKYRDELEILAQTLLEKEVLIKSDLVKLIGPRPFPDEEPVPEVEKEVVPQVDSSIQTEDSES